MSAAIFGNVSSMMLRVYQGTEDYREMLTSIREFIRFHFIPKPLATRLIQSYQHTRAYTHGVDMNSVRRLSLTLETPAVAAPSGGEGALWQITGHHCPVPYDNCIIRLSA